MISWCNESHGWCMEVSRGRETCMHEWLLGRNTIYIFELLVAFLVWYGCGGFLSKKLCSIHEWFRRRKNVIIYIYFILGSSEPWCAGWLAGWLLSFGFGSRLAAGWKKQNRLRKKNIQRVYDIPLWSIPVVMTTSERVANQQSCLLRCHNNIRVSLSDVAAAVRRSCCCVLLLRT